MRVENAVHCILVKNWNDIFIRMDYWVGKLARNKILLAIFHYRFCLTAI